MKPQPHITLTLTEERNRYPWNDENPLQKLPLDKLAEIPKGVNTITVTYLSGEDTIVNITLLKDGAASKHEIKKTTPFTLELPYNRMEIWANPDDLIDNDVALEVYFN